MATTMTNPTTWKRNSILWIVGLLAFSVAGIPLILVVRPAGLVIYLAAIVGGSWAILSWHQRNTAYNCPTCDHRFAVDLTTLTLSPHMGWRKLLTCPSCGENDWCHAVPRDDSAAAPTSPAPRASTASAAGLRRQIVAVCVVAAALWMLVPVLWSSVAEPDQRPALAVLAAAGTLTAVTHAGLLGFALKRGYDDAVYWLITAVLVVTSILLAVAMLAVAGSI